jgi:hypothetical protein
MEVLVAAHHPVLESGGTTTAYPSSYKLGWPDTVLPFTRKQAFRAWTRLNSNDMDLTTWEISMSSRAENFSDLHGSWYSVIMETMILMAYGGVHLAAWSSHFPTKAEMWLWRASALLLAGTTPMAFSLLIPTVLYLIVEELRPSLAKFFRSCFGALGLFLGPPVLAAYLFSRCFLVVESFISLRSVPIGVYSALPWSNWVPHI